jgi:hypothetical protein
MFKVSYEVSMQMLEDNLVSACEGGSGYWARDMEALTKTGKFYKDILKYGFKLRDITDAKTLEGGKIHRVSHAQIGRGLQVMAEKYPRHFGDMMNENGDAETGDVLLQCIVFGKVLYG